jgi:hypothetical protein
MITGNVREGRSPQFQHQTVQLCKQITHKQVYDLEIRPKI